MKKTLLLLLFATLFFSTSAKADDFSFSFTNTLGDVSGTVTGEILGLTNNATGPAAQVLITSFPSGLDSDMGPAPIDATLWVKQYVNTFTETNGEVTAAEFAADPGNNIDILEIDYYGYNSLEIYGSPVGALFVETDGGLAAANIQPLDPVPTPEPSTLGLAFTGLVGLIGLHRKMLTRNV
jgi:hypothetical protein